MMAVSRVRYNYPPFLPPQPLPQPSPPPSTEEKFPKEKDDPRADELILYQQPSLQENIEKLSLWDQLPLLRHPRSYPKINSLVTVSPPLPLYPSYSIFTIAGPIHDFQRSGFIDSFARLARFNRPTSITLCPITQSPIVADSKNAAIRRVEKNAIYDYGSVITISKSPVGHQNIDEGMNQLSNEYPSGFNYPYGIVSSSVYPDYIFFSDPSLHCIFISHRQTGQTRVLAGHRCVAGYRDGIDALFNGPRGICFAHDGRLLVCDANNHAIRSIKIPQMYRSSTLQQNQASPKYSPSISTTSLQPPCSSPAIRSLPPPCCTVLISNDDEMLTDGRQRKRCRSDSCDPLLCLPCCKSMRENENSVTTNHSEYNSSDESLPSSNTSTSDDSLSDDVLVDTVFVYASLCCPSHIAVDVLGWIYLTDEVLNAIYAIGPKDWVQLTVECKDCPSSNSDDTHQNDDNTNTMILCNPSCRRACSLGNCVCVCPPSSRSLTIIGVECDEESLSIQRQMHLAMMSGKEKDKQKEECFDPHAFPSAPHLDLSNYNFSALCSDACNNVYAASFHRNSSTPCIFRLSSISPSFLSLLSQSTCLPYDSLCMIASYCDPGLPMIREKITPIALSPAERLHHQQPPINNAPNDQIVDVTPPVQQPSIPRLPRSHFSGLCIDEYANLLLIADDAAHSIRALTLPHARTFRTSLMVRQRRKTMQKEFLAIHKLQQRLIQ